MTGEAQQVLEEKLKETRNISERQKLLKALWRLHREAEAAEQEKQAAKQFETKRTPRPMRAVAAV